LSFNFVDIFGRVHTKPVQTLSPKTKDEVQHALTVLKKQHQRKYKSKKHKTKKHRKSKNPRH